MKRKKTKFEKWFSLNQHKRRLGARELSDQISTDFAKQKKQVIYGDGKIYTHGSARNTKEHFAALRKEFIGDSELCCTHAKLIVLIRREYQTRKHFAIFEHLWREEKTYLLKNLNTRWLVSAADTFSDHSDDKAIVGLCVAISCLINTVKMQESERYIVHSENCSDDRERIEKLQREERVPLFDGISAFAVGTDDTLRNLRWRMDKMSKINLAGEILLELFLRLQQYDTVFKRFKDRHTRHRTRWW